MNPNMREGVRVCDVLLRAIEILFNFAAWNINTKCYVYAKCQNG